MNEVRLRIADPTEVVLTRQQAEWLAQFMESFFAAYRYTGEDATEFEGAWRGLTLPEWLALLRNDEGQLRRAISPVAPQSLAPAQRRDSEIS